MAEPVSSSRGSSVRQLAKQFESLITNTLLSKTSTVAKPTLISEPTLSPTSSAFTTTSPTAQSVTSPQSTRLPGSQHQPTIFIRHDSDGSSVGSTDGLNTSSHLLLSPPTTTAHQPRRSTLSQPAVQHWTHNDMFNRLSGFGSLMCIDIRIPEQYEAGHIPRAINIPLHNTFPAATPLTEPLTLTDIEPLLQSTTDKRTFKCRARQTVVVYGTDSNDTLPQALCQTLIAEGRVLGAAVLLGCYNTFVAKYPFAICNNTTAVQNHMSVPSSLDFEPQSPQRHSTLTTPITSPIRPPLSASSQSQDVTNTPLSSMRAGRHIHRSAFPWYPNEVLEQQLYIGSHTDAAAPDILQQLGITHVLNVSAEIDNLYPQLFTYQHISLPDTPDSDITTYFTQSNTFIHDALQQNGRVLVHCYQGVSRSSTLIIAHLIHSHKITLFDAYSRVHNARKQVMPNVGFWKQLSAYECSVLGVSEAQSTLHQCVDLQAMELESSMKQQQSSGQVETAAGTQAVG